MFKVNFFLKPGNRYGFLQARRIRDMKIRKWLEDNINFKDYRFPYSLIHLEGNIDGLELRNREDLNLIKLIFSNKYDIVTAKELRSLKAKKK